jgi:AcrR family transcriptional regulator
LVSALQNRSGTPRETTDRLLRAAERVALQEGAHALSIRRIATLSGQNSALISYHFGGLKPLLGQLLAQNVDAVCDARALQQTAALRIRAAGKRLESLVLAYLDPLWRTQAIWHVESARAVIRELMPMLDAAHRRKAVERINASVESTADQMSKLLPHLTRDELLVRLRLLAEAANVMRLPLREMGLFPMHEVATDKLEELMQQQLLRLAMGALRAK